MSDPSPPDDSAVAPQPHDGAPRPLSTRLVAGDVWPPRYHGEPGHGPLRRFSALTWLQTAWPGFAMNFTGEVPESMWSVKDWNGEDLAEMVAVVACPCGQEPEVRQNGTSICSGENCGRVFMLLGDRIKVATFVPDELAPLQPE